MTDDTLPSELQFAHFLAATERDAAARPWRYKPIATPPVVVERDAYDEETERLRRFIRGQQITKQETAA